MPFSRAAAPMALLLSAHRMQSLANTGICLQTYLSSVPVGHACGLG